MSDTAETRRQMGDLIREAHVTRVDGGVCFVAFTENGPELGPYPWLVVAAGETIVWSKPSDDEQILLLCPDADAERGVVLRGLYSTAFPAPSSADVEMVRFKDGAVLQYDPEAHHLAVTLPEGATIAVTADVTLDGKLDATGKIASEDDVLADGKSLKNHRHTAVQAGPAVSGPPQ